MFFKQVMSDFAFKRANDKIRNIAKSNAAQNSACIASMNEVLAKNYVESKRVAAVEKLLKELIALYKKQAPVDDDVDEDFINVCLVECHAIIQKDVDEDFINIDSLKNKIKVLVNLKLLPQRFLLLDAEYTD